MAPRQPAHKVGVVWAWSTGRKPHREQNFLKKPAHSSCTFDLAAHRGCACVYVRAVKFPASFAAYLPCRGSQSPLSQLFLSCWRDLSISVFVPALNRSHTESFLTRQKDVLSPDDDSVEKSQLVQLPCFLSDLVPCLWLEPVVCLGVIVHFTAQECLQSSRDTCCFTKL